MSNSDNPRWGAEFQRQVRRWFEAHYDLRFEEEVKFPIGSRLVDHHEYKEYDISNTYSFCGNIAGEETCGCSICNLNMAYRLLRLHSAWIPFYPGSFSKVV